ncbi:hypothetical protein GCM10011297_23910 [Bacterioplanes sanyensis]|uniref:PepSY domain-containing protein n=1 Tax=Bacterioplanes sanyensis TaxID=1249553 RepID=UPI00167B0115|nr:PepSY domain-containing protein [Bacterioplanes sanyensis]GGY50266.1 hypothetical protein GCM10011297_23910 [Bacterioplanes sanyensis]
MKTLLTLSALIALSSPSWADDYSPQQVQELVSAGIIQSLDQLLSVNPMPGKLLDTELESEDGRWVYELTWLDEQGLRHETYIDAKDGRWLEDEIED